MTYPEAAAFFGPLPRSFFMPRLPRAWLQAARGTLPFRKHRR